ncbi:acetyltransferase [Aliivibrio fischeri]|uniref:acetyltransferase n=1 Tax=Aliivibrio fischeri TaxID=668 RepID=UPI0018C512BC|nr:acetyltransferase [Aliivibrio fischeri]
MSKPCVIIGCGSHASSVISITESSKDNLEIIGLIDTANNYDVNEKKSGYQVLSNLKELLCSPEKYSGIKCILAIGNNSERRSVYNQLKKHGYKFPNVISDLSYIDRTVCLGEGNIIGHGVIINSEVRLGNNNLINTNATIEHHCSINNHCHVAPNATLCGGVKIQDEVLLGAGSVVVPNILVTERSTVGAGSVLLTDISIKQSIYVGKPAKGITK